MNLTQENMEGSEFMQILARRVVLTESLRKRLRQDRVWVDQQGREHSIATLDPGYAKNIVAWLERRAKALHAGESAEWLFYPEPPAETVAYDLYYDEHRWLDEADPVEWLSQMPLVTALRERVESAP